MYAILVVDALAEKSNVMSTLAADDLSAMVLMLATAEGWVGNQPVDLGYTINEELNAHRVTVTCGTSVVLSITAQSIDSVIGAAELRAFCKPPNGSKH